MLQFLDKVFSCFTKHNPAQNVKLFIADKDFNELALIRKFFANARINLCRFHTLRVFNRKTQSLPSPIKDEVRKLLSKLVYSSSEEYCVTFSTLKTSAPAQFIDYFMDNWDNCKEMWTDFGRNLTSNFSNHTTNRLESYHQKLKSILAMRKTLTASIKAVTAISSSKQLMNDQFGFLQKVSQFDDIKLAISTDARKLNSIVTPYAAKKVEGELLASPKDIKVSVEGENFIASDNQYKTRVVNKDATRCSCSFQSSNELPCRHIFAVRILCSLDVIEENLFGKRWLRSYQSVQSTEFGMPSSSPKNLVAKTPTKKMKILSANQKYRYTRALSIAKELASITSQVGTRQFHIRLEQLETLRDLWLQQVGVSISKKQKDSSARTIDFNTKRPNDGAVVLSDRKDECDNLNEPETVTNVDDAASPDGMDLPGSSSVDVCKSIVTSINIQAAVDNKSSVCFDSFSEENNGSSPVPSTVSQPSIPVVTALSEQKCIANFNLKKKVKLRGRPSGSTQSVIGLPSAKKPKKCFNELAGPDITEKKVKLTKHIAVPAKDINRSVCGTSLRNIDLKTLENDGWLDDQVIFHELYLVVNASELE